MHDVHSFKLRKGDWIRFQLKSDRRVLEGFVQDLAPEGDQVLIGKDPAWPENQWHRFADLEILHHQQNV